MRAIQPSRADLASILTDEERIELQGYLWGSILSGPISVPTGERICEIEKEIEERWLYDPENRRRYLARKVRAWLRAHTNS